MKDAVLLLALLFLVSGNLMASERQLSDLESLRWKNRVLLVFVQDTAVQTARANLNHVSAGIEERDLVWFLLTPDALQTNYPDAVGPSLRDELEDRYFSPSSARPTVILIGKDGQVKSRGPDLDLESTFGLIDKMPMRQAEMRRAKVTPD